MIKDRDRAIVCAEVQRALHYLVNDMGINAAAVLSVAHLAIALAVVDRFGIDAAAENARDVLFMLETMAAPPPETATLGLAAGRRN